MIEKQTVKAKLPFQIGALLLALTLVTACETTDSVNVTTKSVADNPTDDGGDDTSGDDTNDGTGGDTGDGSGGTDNTGTVGKVTDATGTVGGKVLHVAGSTTILLAALIDRTGGQLPAPVGGVVGKVGGTVNAVGTKVGGLGTSLATNGLSGVPVVGSTVTVVDGLSASLLKTTAVNHTLLGYSNPASNQLVNVSVLSNSPQTGKSGLSANVLSTGSVAKVAVGGTTLVDIPSGGGLSGGGSGTGGGATNVVSGATSTVGGLLNKVVSLK